MASESILRVFTGPCILLVFIYLVWFIRYPVWWLFGFIEPIFVVLIASYFAVLLFALLLLKKEAKKSLSKIFATRNYAMLLTGAVFAFLFQIVWFSIYLLIGGKLELTSFPSLEEYGSYAVYSIPSAFGLYLLFAVFGAFAEEVAFRSYVQSRLSSRLNIVLSIFGASSFFALEHIHVFDIGWIAKFFQTQFLDVFCFGILFGYFFFLSHENLLSAFAFHGLGNVLNVSLPVKTVQESLVFNQATTIVTFILMILLLHFLFRKGKIK